jgi:hypothetical protein
VDTAFWQGIVMARANAQTKSGMRKILPQARSSEPVEGY